MFAGKGKVAALPLQPIQVEKPFMKWGLDFIGFINPPSSASHKWVLLATDYFTKWTKAMALKEANEITGQEYMIGIIDCVYLNTSSNYYPEGNGKVESTKKNLLRIIKRTMEGNQRAWHTKMKSTLWVDRITPKRSTGTSPYMLVYGKEVRLPISLELPALDLANHLDMIEEEPMTGRLA
ncbi:uncharacterized protein LOC131874260 [Cryptomeria japonica]|uniref:uncharacterized protein LOC131874260 n=1 Tax=Cryptomeria japonica TaxID=3369 RepID=UPI0027DA7726|nr:uncharacterized protein LOC131874260 [Cryptomeria japonica]